MSGISDSEQSDDYEPVALEKTECVDPAKQDEVRAWYVYDFANSPYWQVYVTALMPIVLTWLAEGYAAGAVEHDSSQESGLAPVSPNHTNSSKADAIMPGLGITAGSYAPLVNGVTLAFQTISLFTFSALGDYGNTRKRSLVICTYASAFFVFLHIFTSFSYSMWWFAGLTRVFAGIFFAMSGVYYNAYLPVLAEQHEDAVSLQGKERGDKVIELSDDISNKGQLTGYFGGLLMLVISWVILYFMECDRNKEECTVVALLFWPNLCIALVAVWFSVFALYPSFKLKPRPGPPPPEGNILCLGWKGVCNTCKELREYPQTARFLIAFFLFSDAVNTLTSVSVLILEDEADASGAEVLFLAILAVVGALGGGWAFLGIQKLTGVRSKILIMIQLTIYTILCIFALCGALTYSGFTYYLIMGPMMLMIGSLQAYARAIFASLCPSGSEASMFAFFEVTDKGSNIIGAFVMFAVHNVFHSYIPTFGYLIFNFAISLCILFCVDVHQGVVDVGKADDEDFLCKKDGAEDEDEWEYEE